MSTPLIWSNISATPAAFTLAGGWYTIAYVATWNSGTVTLEYLGPDGSTYLTATTAFSANGLVTVQLPPGVYKLVVASATAVYVSIKSINLNNP